MTTFTFAQQLALRAVLVPAIESMRFGKSKTGRVFVEPELNLPKGDLRITVGSKIFEVSVTPWLPRDGNVIFKIVRTA